MATSIIPNSQGFDAVCCSPFACTCPACAESADHASELDERARLIALFDVVADVRCTVDIFAHRYGEDVAADTLRIWCGAHLLPMRRMYFVSANRPMLSTVVDLPNGSQINLISEIKQ